MDFIKRIIALVSSFLVSHWDTEIEPLQHAQEPQIPAPAPIITPIPAPMPTEPIQPVAPVSEPPEPLLFDTPKHAYHAIRVLCDQADLSISKTIVVNGALWAPKDIICACIFQESRFYNYRDGFPVKNLNLNKDGSVSSTDWGICQVNDYFHVETGHDFPSVEYILANPESVARWMIGMYKKGQLGQWSSYKFGAFRQWLLPKSPMWNLAS